LLNNRSSRGDKESILRLNWNFQRRVSTLGKGDDSAKTKPQETLKWKAYLIGFPYPFPPSPAPKLQTLNSKLNPKRNTFLQARKPSEGFASAPKIKIFEGKAAV